MGLGLSPGLVVAERYRLDALVDEGGMSCVWAATNLVTAKPVALKFLKHRRRPGLSRCQGIAQEARLTILHPHVVRIYDLLYLGEKTPFIVMELLRGRTLRDELRRQGKIALSTTCKIVSQVVSALSCCHAQGIVHRDLKPDNIFLCTTADGNVYVKVLDFGIAKEMTTVGDRKRRGSATNQHRRLGTVGYAAPEQDNGSDVDDKADIWALGVILYECLTGQRPFSRDTWEEYIRACATSKFCDVVQLNPHISEDISNLIRRMLSCDKTLRPHLHQVVQGLGGSLDEMRRASEPPGSAHAFHPGRKPATTVADDFYVETITSEEFITEDRERLPKRLQRGALWISGVLVAISAVVVLTVTALSMKQSLTWARPTRHDPFPTLTQSTSPTRSNAAELAAQAPQPNHPGPEATAESSSLAPDSPSQHRLDVRINKATKSIKVVFSPEDAYVEVDGVLTDSKDGTVELPNRKGHTYRLRIFKGNNQISVPVMVDQSRGFPQAIAPPQGSATSSSQASTSQPSSTSQPHSSNRASDAESARPLPDGIIKSFQ